MKVRAGGNFGSAVTAYGLDDPYGFAEIDRAKLGRLTCVELVRKHWPNATREQAERVLMLHTNFPFGKADELDQELKVLADRFELGVLTGPSGGS